MARTAGCPDDCMIIVRTWAWSGTSSIAPHRAHSYLPSLRLTAFPFSGAGPIRAVGARLDRSLRPAGRIVAPFPTPIKMLGFVPPNEGGAQPA
jgi:hypothetical protein